MLTHSDDWCPDIPAVDAEASRLVQLAAEACPAVEARLKFLADTHNGTMVGLEYKIKPQASLSRKMAAMWSGPQLSLQDVIDAQYDVLRFTMLLPLERHAFKVESVLADLSKEGFPNVEIKNYWNALTYRGINCILTTPMGIRFELQFHTAQSFDQKQNRTHLLYEALRVEKHALKQNLYYMDMVAMWDTVVTPADILSVGTEKVQPPPQLRNVTADESEAIARIVEVKNQVRNALRPLFESLRKIEPRIDPLMQYCCKSFNATLRNIDAQVKGTLNAQRKIEEDLRRTLKHSDAENLQHIKFPANVKDIIAEFALAQPDLLMYTVVFDSDEDYTAGTLGIIDTLVMSGFKLLYADNHWCDHEKHHPISVAFEIQPDHPVRRNRAYSLKFAVEFHTAETYRGATQRAVAKTLLEEALYRRGDAYKKSYVDVTLRFDPGLCDMWMCVQVPRGAEAIGRKHTFDSMGTAECKSHSRRWHSPAESAERRRLITFMISGFAVGVGLSIAIAHRLRSAPQ